MPPVQISQRLLWFTKFRGGENSGGGCGSDSCDLVNCCADFYIELAMAAMVAIIVAVACSFLAIVMMFIRFEKQIDDLWDSSKLHNETMMRVIDENERILNAIPRAKENLDETKQILELAKKQQNHIATIRQDWIQANMLLNEVCETMSMIGGDAKPDEALHYMRLATKKFADDSKIRKKLKTPSGLKTPEVTVDDSHVDKKRVKK